MKTTSLLVITCFFVIGASAQRISDLPQNKAMKRAQPAPPVQAVSQDSIIFNKLEHNYGTIEYESDGNTVFTFTNKGKSPIVLSNVSASCGCTTPEWTTTPVVPGGKGVVKVKYNTTLPGTFNKTITVISNAANANVMLRIKGNVKPKP